MSTCRATRSFAEPFGPDNICGGEVAGFSIYLDPRRVSRLLTAGNDEIPDVEPIPIGYCTEHLSRYEEAVSSSVHEDGSAIGILWIKGKTK